MFAFKTNAGIQQNSEQGFYNVYLQTSLREEHLGDHPRKIWDWHDFLRDFVAICMGQRENSKILG